MRHNSSGIKAEWPFLIAISYPEYINRMASCLHSTDNFLAMEAQVHLKLAKHSKKTCGYLDGNPGESPNCQNVLIFDFYWRLSHIHCLSLYTLQTLIYVLHILNVYMETWMYMNRDIAIV